MKKQFAWEYYFLVCVTWVKSSVGEWERTITWSKLSTMHLKYKRNFPAGASITIQFIHLDEY